MREEPHILLQIEKRYQVEQIRANGLPLWPFMRNHIGSYLTFQRGIEAEITTGVTFQLIKNLGFGFWNLFKPARSVFMSSKDQRKFINGVYVDRMNYYIDALGEDRHIFIEQPSLDHFPYRKTKGKNNVSKTWFNLIERIYALFISVEITGEEILQQLLSDYDIPLNYRQKAKKFIAQYRVSQFFFKRKKSAYFFCTTAYMNTPRIKAAKELQIEVVEFQHGIINENHYGYNLCKTIDPQCYPDYLLTFGEKEREVFPESNHYVAQERVLPIGSFYIDHLLENPTEKHPLIQQLRKQYTLIIAFSCQDAMETLWVPFLKSVAENDPRNAYILMPRHKTMKAYAPYHFPSNVYGIPDLNTYQIIQQANIHSTINSTTAIEALALGTPNILLNINNLSVRYTEKMHLKFTHYAATPEAFLHHLKHFTQPERAEVIQSNKQNIVPSFTKRIPGIIKILRG
ncbi:MAG: hypothetical protein CSA95_04520 [Bacteroidetes bacterium]|nr:MAG: hypothetical protein CSA95_04520 [Bacteroidota bacterium]PIE88380.1 MAG: hypothetical protein CSA04_02215 [Bacteroidota bacterium]